MIDFTFTLQGEKYRAKLIGGSVDTDYRFKLKFPNDSSWMEVTLVGGETGHPAAYVDDGIGGGGRLPPDIAFALAHHIPYEGPVSNHEKLHSF